MLIHCAHYFIHWSFVNKIIALYILGVPVLFINPFRAPISIYYGQRLWFYNNRASNFRIDFYEPELSMQQETLLFMNCYGSKESQSKISWKAMSWLRCLVCIQRTFFVFFLTMSDWNFVWFIWNKIWFYRVIRKSPWAANSTEREELE